MRTIYNDTTTTSGLVACPKCYQYYSQTTGHTCSLEFKGEYIQTYVPTLESIRKDKNQLANQIKELIIEFNKKTGIAVNHINIKNNRYNNGYKEYLIQDIDIELERI